jgi:ribonuclease G
LPDWLREAGIGETRCVRVADGRIVDSRILLDGALAAGTIVAARLASIGHGGRNAVARTPDGTDILLPVRPAGVAEGARIAVELRREAIPGIEPWKRPLGRATADLPHAASLDGDCLPFPLMPGGDRLEAAGWSDLLEQARSGTIDFPGGALRLSVTPAMTLIDVDGTLPIDALAIAGARASGEAIRRLGIGGSIGIDLPTVRGKDARTAAAAALDAAMGDAAFERTAVNGFGFLQLVRPRRFASLLELAADRPRFEARALLRTAALAGHGPCRLAAAPSVIAVLDAAPLWLDALAAQRGGAVHLRADPLLAMSGGHAEPC